MSHHEPRHNLPARLDSFVGRERELTEMTDCWMVRASSHSSVLQGSARRGSRLKWRIRFPGFLGWHLVYRVGRPR